MLLPWFFGINEPNSRKIFMLHAWTLNARTHRTPKKKKKNRENKFTWIQLANHSKSISNQNHHVWKNSSCLHSVLDLSKSIISFSMRVGVESFFFQWILNRKSDSFFFSQANLAIRTFTIHPNATCDCWIYEMDTTELKSAKTCSTMHACTVHNGSHSDITNRVGCGLSSRVSCVRLLPKPFYILFPLVFSIFVLFHFFFFIRSSNSNRNSLSSSSFNWNTYFGIFFAQRQNK